MESFAVVVLQLFKYYLFIKICISTKVTFDLNIYVKIFKCNVFFCWINCAQAQVEKLRNYKLKYLNLAKVAHGLMLDISATITRFMLYIKAITFWVMSDVSTMNSCLA